MHPLPDRDARDAGGVREAQAARLSHRRGEHRRRIPRRREEIRELGLTFDILQDRSTAIQLTYQTTGVPESFLLNQQGVIVKRVMGSHDWSSPVNVALINRLLDEAGAPRAP